MRFAWHYQSLSDPSVWVQIDAWIEDALSRTPVARVRSGMPRHAAVTGRARHAR